MPLPRTPRAIRVFEGLLVAAVLPGLLPTVAAIGVLFTPHARAWFAGRPTWPLLEAAYLKPQDCGATPTASSAVPSFRQPFVQLPSNRSPPGLVSVPRPWAASLRHAPS